MFQIKVIEKIKIDVLYSINFFSECRAVNEIGRMSKYIVEPEAANGNVEARCMLD